MSRLVVSAVLLLLFLPAVLQAQNLVVNGDFDTDLVPWFDEFGSADFPAAWSSTDAGSSPSSGSMRLTNKDSGSEETDAIVGVRSQCVPVSGGAAYDVRVAELVPPGQSRTGFATLRLAFHANPSCSSYLATGPDLRSTIVGAWQQRSDVATAPAGAQSAVIQLATHKDAPGGSFAAHFDQVELVTHEASSDCTQDTRTLCLNGGRFEVTIDWVSDAASGEGHALSGDPLGVTSGGLFWFFSADNPEVLVKVVNLCAVLGHYGVFVAATTNVEYHLTVRDTVTGMTHTYDNTLGLPAEPVQDNATFAVCP